MKTERFNENYTIVMYTFYSIIYGGHCYTFHYGYPKLLFVLAGLEEEQISYDY